MVLNRAQMSSRLAAQFIGSQIGSGFGSASLPARRRGGWRWLGGTLLLSLAALPSAWAQEKTAPTASAAAPDKVADKAPDKAASASAVTPAPAKVEPAKAAAATTPAKAEPAKAAAATTPAK